MMDSLPSSSAVAPQMAPKPGFSLGKLITESWERISVANTAICGGKQLMDGSNNVGLEWQMR